MALQRVTIGFQGSQVLALKMQDSDLDALLAALESGRLAGVGLDVLPEEPPSGHPLLTHPRALLTPHVAWYSEEAEAEVRRKAAQNVVSWAESGRPTYAVVDGR